MTQKNNEFEKSAKEAGFLNHPIHGLIVRHSNGSWVGVSEKLEYLYQAAKADSEGILLEQQNTIAELKAHINMLREALKNLIIVTKHLKPCEETLNVAEQTLYQANYKSINIELTDDGVSNVKAR